MYQNARYVFNLDLLLHSVDPTYSLKQFQGKMERKRNILNFYYIPIQHFSQPHRHWGGQDLRFVADLFLDTVETIISDECVVINHSPHSLPSYSSIKARVTAKKIRGGATNLMAPPTHLKTHLLHLSPTHTHTKTT